LEQKLENLVSQSNNLRQSEEPDGKSTTISTEIERIRTCSPGDNPIKPESLEAEVKPHGTPAVLENRSTEQVPESDRPQIIEDTRLPSDDPNIPGNLDH
jgi:hypothetical protein